MPGDRRCAYHVGGRNDPRNDHKETKEMMRNRMLSNAIRCTVLGVAAVSASGCTSLGGTDMAVREVGSMHVGGRPLTLSGLPTREIVFTAGSPPFRIDPNGDAQTLGSAA